MDKQIKKICKKKHLSYIVSDGITDAEEVFCPICGEYTPIVEASTSTKE